LPFKKEIKEGQIYRLRDRAKVLKVGQKKVLIVDCNRFGNPIDDPQEVKKADFARMYEYSKHEL